MELYEFQKADVAKIARQKAGLIGSEMGAGKTHVAIALDEIWNAEVPDYVPTLVVAPLNTFDSWQEKYAMQAPDVRVFTIDRKNREAFVKAIKNKKADVFLMHWDALRLMPELQEIQFQTIIADEVHRISNQKSQQTRALKKLKTVHKLALSGTATGDKPQGLWSILNWLWPSYYKSFWKFVDHYTVRERTGEGQGAYFKFTGVKNIASLMEQMSPWYVRHLKRDQCCEDHPNGVMEWLPEKTYDTIWVDLSPQQRKFYEQMRKEMVAWVNDQEDSPLVASLVVTQLMRLQQMALATPQVDGIVMVPVKDKDTGEVIGERPKQLISLHAPSSKIDAVIERINDGPEDKQYVVFSSSKQVCYLAQQEFAAAGITAEVLSGDTPQSQRQGMVARFNNRGYRVFIGAIQAAAEGIDGLQHSTDTAFFLDRSWSTVKNMQAEDRLHRGGTKNTVSIIDVMARDTVDFGRKQKLVEKWEFIKHMLGDFHNQVEYKEAA